MNLKHGLHASSRSGAGPHVHPIALYRRSVLVEYCLRRQEVFVLLNYDIAPSVDWISIQFVLEEFKARLQLLE